MNVGLHADYHCAIKEDLDNTAAPRCLTSTIIVSISCAAFLDYKLHYILH